MLATIVLVGACAEVDPYRRLEPGPTGTLTSEQAPAAFDQRWPVQFKAVQTVTIDFGPVTRTLVGYLIVQQPGRFRLQGMTEQGIKLFDIIGGTGGDMTVAFAADEFDRKVLVNIARDIRRVFLASAASLVGEGFTTEISADAAPSKVRVQGRLSGLHLWLAGPLHQIDRYDYRRDGRSLFRADYYEWKDFDADADNAARPTPGSLFLPSVIVLRERGVQSDGPAYKLTIEITELTVRKKAWPDRVFEAAPEQD